MNNNRNDQNLWDDDLRGPTADRLRRELRAEADRLGPANRLPEILDRADAAGERPLARRLAPIGVAAGLIAIATLIWSVNGGQTVSPAGRPDPTPIGSPPATTSPEPTRAPKPMESAPVPPTIRPAAPATTPSWSPAASEAPLSADSGQRFAPSSLAMTVSTTGALIEGVTPADRIALDWTLDRAGKQLTSGKLLSGDAGTPGSFRIGLGALEPGRYALDVWATDGADYSVHQEFTVDGADTSRPAPAASSGFPSTTPAPPTSFSGTRLSPPSPASTTSAPAHLPPATRPLSAPPIADGPTTG